MEVYYCKFCEKNINVKLKMKHENTKSHLYNANYITEEIVYHNVILDDVKKIIFEHANIFKYRFNEFLIKVKCEINGRLYTTQKETYWRLKNGDYVVRGMVRKQINNCDEILKEICCKIFDGLTFRNNHYPSRKTKVKKLTIQFVGDYDKMTLRHHLQQPRSILESQLIKHIKNKRKINRRSFAFILERYELMI